MYSSQQHWQCTALLLIAALAVCYMYIVPDGVLVTKWLKLCCSNVEGSIDTFLKRVHQLCSASAIIKVVIMRLHGYY